ncbi:hypothetical protein [Tumebacillus permanentifrigoris]|nr:hypothetical protein [Tumebacillus permanentifrigoris]
MKKVVLAGVLVAFGLFITVAGFGTSQHLADGCTPPAFPNVFIWGD